MDASATPARNEKRFRPTLKSLVTVSAVAFGLSCLSVSCSNTAAPEATPTTSAPNTSTTSTPASTTSTPTSSTPSTTTVDDTPDTHTTTPADAGLTVLYAGHSFGRPFAREMTELTRSAGIDGHEQRVVFRGGSNGAPQAMWQDPEVQALIKEQLNDGAVDIVVLICCSEELLQTDFQRDQAILEIVDYALAQNPETRFQLAMPWSNSPHTYATAADHRAGTDAAYPHYQLLAESVSAASGGAEASAFYHGAAVYEIRSRYENGLIPELTALIGPRHSSVFTDETGHAGSMAKDAGTLIWLNALYEINPLDLPPMNAYDVDIRAIAAAALSATGETTPPPAATTSANIIVEQPAPEAQTTNPLVISGEANTFEATVRYAVTNDNGDLLIEGFTTAAIYDFGTWGPFEVTIDAADFPADYQPGPGKITMWEDNSGDEGPDRINVVEVPVILPER